MPDTRVPITDAFDDTDDWESLQVELTPEQIAWLEEKAEERGVSVDHMLRTVLTAQMRGSDEIPSPSSGSGDGAPQSTTTPTSGRSESAGTSNATDSDTDTPSIVESLRSASERLDDLTEEEEAEESNLGDTLTRLKGRANNLANRSSEEEDDNEEDPGTVLMDEQSMFDMVD